MMLWRYWSNSFTNGYSRGAGIIISMIGTMLVKINDNDAKEDKVIELLIKEILLL